MNMITNVGVDMTEYGSMKITTKVGNNMTASAGLKSDYECGAFEKIGLGVSAAHSLYSEQQIANSK